MDSIVERAHRNACAYPSGSSERGFWVGVSDALAAQRHEEIETFIRSVNDAKRFGLRYQAQFMLGFAQATFTFNKAVAENVMGIRQSRKLRASMRPLTALFLALTAATSPMFICVDDTFEAAISYDAA